MLQQNAQARSFSEHFWLHKIFLSYFQKNSPSDSFYKTTVIVKYKYTLQKSVETQLQELGSLVTSRDSLPKLQ